MAAPDVMGRAEIARRLSVTPERASVITRRRSFPRPVGRITLGRVWAPVDVEAWIRDNWSAR